MMATEKILQSATSIQQLWWRRAEKDYEDHEDDYDDVENDDGDDDDDDNDDDDDDDHYCFPWIMGPRMGWDPRAQMTYCYRVQCWILARGDGTPSRQW